METFERQTVSASYQNTQNQVTVNYDNNAVMTNYGQYTNEIIPRRNNDVDSSLKRKLDQNVSALHNKQLDEFYSYNMGSNLL